MLGREGQGKAWEERERKGRGERRK